MLSNQCHFCTLVTIDVETDTLICSLAGEIGLQGMPEKINPSTWMDVLTELFLRETYVPR